MSCCERSFQTCLPLIVCRRDLDEDHYGLDKVKKRIIEYLAVRQLKTASRDLFCVLLVLLELAKQASGSLSLTHLEEDSTG